MATVLTRIPPPSHLNLKTATMRTCQLVSRIIICHHEFTLFQIIGHVFVWRPLAEVFPSGCLFSGMKHGEGSLVVFCVLSWSGLGSFVVLIGNIITCEHYILANHVRPMLQILFHGERFCSLGSLCSNMSMMLK